MIDWYGLGPNAKLLELFRTATRVVIRDLVFRNSQLETQVTSLLENGTKQINEIRRLKKELDEAKRNK